MNYPAWIRYADARDEFYTECMNKMLLMMTTTTEKQSGDHMIVRSGTNPKTRNLSSLPVRQVSSQPDALADLLVAVTLTDNGICVSDQLSKL